MSLTDTYTEDFEQLWSVWPRKPVGRSKKAPSYKAFQAAKKALEFTQSDIDDIQADIEKRTREDSKWAMGFVPMFSTYFNQRWWNEDYTRIRASSGSQEKAETPEEANRKHVAYLIRLKLPIPEALKAYMPQPQGL